MSSLLTAEEKKLPVHIQHYLIQIEKDKRAYYAMIKRNPKAKVRNPHGCGGPTVFEMREALANSGCSSGRKW